MTVQVEFIKSLPYFSGLNQVELDSIRKFIFEKKTERGEILLFEGEPAEMLYFVAAGVVKVFKTSADGKEQILYIVRPGESFNDVPVYGGGVNLTSAEAMGAVVLNPPGIPAGSPECNPGSVTAGAAPGITGGRPLFPACYRPGSQDTA
jgi:hypothetical protein